jgi:hypothetical protein
MTSEITLVAAVVSNKVECPPFRLGSQDFVMIMLLLKPPQPFPELSEVVVQSGSCSRMFSSKKPWESQIRTAKVIKINNKKIKNSGCLTYILKKLNCYKAPLRDYFFFTCLGESS